MRMETDVCFVKNVNNQEHDWIEFQHQSNSVLVWKRDLFSFPEEWKGKRQKGYAQLQLTTCFRIQDMFNMNHDSYYPIKNFLGQMLLSRIQNAQLEWFSVFQNPNSTMSFLAFISVQEQKGNLEDYFPFLSKEIR